MGWGRRVIVFLVGLFALVFGFWPLSLLALGYLLISFRGPKRQSVYLVKERERFGPPGRPWKRYVFGGFLVFLGAAAFASGGTISPVFYGGLGLLVISWDWLKSRGYLSRVTPVSSSILLRKTAFPIYWTALVEVKLGANNPVRAVASLEGTILLLTGEHPRAYLPVSALAIGRREAELSVAQRIKKISASTIGRGAYFLPLESHEASDILSASLTEVEMQPEDIEGLASFPFDLLAVKTEKGRVKAIGAYKKRFGEAGEAVLPQPCRKALRAPLFWELVELINERHGWPAPDEFSGFLESLELTRGEPIGERLSLVGQSPETLVIASPGGAKVELARTQFRALAMIYG